jgi:hypothetical protein
MSSNNQISVADVLLVWWYGLALGAERFEHFTRYRRDALLPRLLGLPRFLSPDTLRRFFHRFSYGHTTAGVGLDDLVFAPLSWRCFITAGS